MQSTYGVARLARGCLATYAATGGENSARRFSLRTSSSSNAGADADERNRGDKTVSDAAETGKTGITQPEAKADRPKAKGKLQAQRDAEIQAKMAELAGDGGDAGVECENGKPVSMKRSVRDNMFRYI